MATLPKFRYSLKREDDLRWYYVQGGIVRISTTARYLEEGVQTVAPKDWKGTVLELSRNEKLHGVFTKFSVPVNFTFQAQQILKELWSYDGYEATAIFIIETRDEQGIYSEFYRANIDMSTVEGLNDNDNYQLSVATTEAGIVEDLKNKESLNVSIPFDGDAVTVQNDGIKLLTGYNWLGGNSMTPLNYTHLPVNSSDDFIVDLAPAGSESNPFLNSFVIQKTQNASIQNRLDANNVTLHIGNTVAAIFDMELEFDVDVTTDVITLPTIFGIRLWEYSFIGGTGVRSLNSVLYSSPSLVFSGAPQTFTGVRSLTTTLSAFRSYRVEFIVINLIPGTQINYVVRNLRLKINGQVRLPQSTYPTFMYKTFLDKFFKKMLGNTVSVLSDFLDAGLTYAKGYDCNPKFVTVTSGEAIRGINNPVIKTNFNDVYDDMQRWGLHVGVQGGNIRVEPLPFFYNKSHVITRLGNVSSVKFTNANNLLANIVKTGYKPRVYDELNGREDFFSTNEHSFPSKRINNTLSIVSPYYSSPWAIEYARTYKLSGKETTDSQYDNDTYLTEVADTPVGGLYVLRRDNSAGVFGVTFPDTVYNLGLSPGTFPYYNADRILAMGWGKPINNGLPITFQINDKRNNVNRFQSSKYIKENGDLQFSDLRIAPNHKPGTSNIQGYCKPVVIEIKAELTEQNIKDLQQPNADRYGVIEFIHPDNGQIFSIFILDVGVYPETKEQYLIRGLSSPDNDLSKL